MVKTGHASKPAAAYRRGMKQLFPLFWVTGLQMGTLSRALLDNGFSLSPGDRNSQQLSLASCDVLCKTHSALLAMCPQVTLHLPRTEKLLTEMYKEAEGTGSSW